MSVRRLLCLLLVELGISCTGGSKKAEPALFELLPSSATGIHFINAVADTKEFNIFKYRNFYNGGGVAIGDVNNDGKPDIFFTSNQHQNTLYLNRGNWKFEDVTEHSHLASTHKWHTGVTMADVNGDGWLDIYVCNSGSVNGDDRSNELYINQKDGTFKEEAHLYGLDDKGESTQAVFFDFDHDGDLDCFVLNNSNRSVESFGYDKGLRSIRDPRNGDRLYRNDGGKFVDVSAQAGIFGSEIGFGLGITVGDVNNDGWEDMYVSNDFFERDYLYINQHDGTFREVLDDAMGHISQGSMGSDMADMNNDGFLDIFTTEMLPESDYRLKTTIKFEDYDVLGQRSRLGFHHQFTSNCLQLNNHDGTFSEIAQLSGVDATGWSWGALSFDFDNDGWKDIFVCNGISKDLTDQDFLEFFGSQEMMQQVREHGLDFKNLLSKMPAVPITSYAFLNQHDLTFKNVSDSFGIRKPAFSNGAAYADLDGDGDLDLVINNENMEAFVYRNLASEKLHNHYLNFRLKGNPPNTFGLGSRVAIYSKGTHQVVEQMPARGFESSVDPTIHFGTGKDSVVDSVLVRWTNGREQMLRHILTDTTITLHEQDATLPQSTIRIQPVKWYSNVAGQLTKGNIVHRENEFIDFNEEKFIPKLLSTEGPKLAVGDINGDGLEDFYMGSAIADTAKLFIQQADGRFIVKMPEAFVHDKYYENTGAVFFDADGDGDLDLVVASGGNQAKQGSPYLFTRLYINDGKGNLSRSGPAWPLISVNASCVRIGDFDGDGRPDVFVGARSVPGSYGVIPGSVLLHNNGGGSFTDVTASVASDLGNCGMVTDAQWADIDGDGKKELVLVGDWMAVTVFKFDGQHVKKQYEIPNSAGWWNCLTVADVNGDGRPDLIAGNWGLNSRIRADTNHPAKLYVGDFAHNGKTECIPVFYKSDGKAYPYFLKGEMESEIPLIKKQFLHFSNYAGKGIKDIFNESQLKGAQVLSVQEMRTCIFINQGSGKFAVHALPQRAQFSPVYGILSADLNDDGKSDLFLAGNFFGVKPQTGRFDANYGTTLLGDGSGNYKYAAPVETGLFLRGEARDVSTIKSRASGKYILVTINNDSLCIFKKSVQNNAITEPQPDARSRRR